MKKLLQDLQTFLSDKPQKRSEYAAIRTPQDFENWVDLFITNEFSLLIPSVFYDFEAIEKLSKELNIDFNSLTKKDLTQHPIDIEGEIKNIVFKGSIQKELIDIIYSIKLKPSWLEVKLNITVSNVEGLQIIRDYVNKCNALFGQDDFFKTEFNENDLKEYKTGWLITLRNYKFPFGMFSKPDIHNAFGLKLMHHKLNKQLIYDFTFCCQ